MVMADPKPVADRLRMARPLSPHLQIFRPMLTMTMSIVHRITGGALYFGTLLVALWLMAAATGPLGFDACSGSWAHGSAG